uniref:Uncharacterized protein n=1 Tax=Arundo donax TaxID=35708 RepID=A0A0A9EPP4_ARUDO
MKCLYGPDRFRQSITFLSSRFEQ